MTPKEKADKLCIDFLMKPNTADIRFGMDKQLAKQCALITVDEILEATKVKWATQRKLPNGEWKFWKGVSYKNYWVKVKTEIEKL